MSAFVTILFLLGLIAAVSLVLAVPIMLLWNWVAVAVLGFPTVTLFQAWGLNLLAHLLFGQTCTNYVINGK
jgi:hypothetical protein